MSPTGGMVVVVMRELLPGTERVMVPAASGCSDCAIACIRNHVRYQMIMIALQSLCVLAVRALFSNANTRL
jgi:hypothetical protein